MTRRLPAFAATVGLGLVALLSACSGGSSAAGGDGLKVAAAFYPLQFAVQQVGGEDVSVTGLTKPGGEPHDLELTPQQVGDLASADLVVFEKGFQPAVDQAVTSQAADSGFDVSSAARLTLASAEGDDHDHAGESEAEHEEHADEAGASGADPHFWLDPTRYADVATAIAARLGELDPEHATAYTTRGSEFAAKLRALDGEFSQGLQGCRISTLVTGHAAFGYLADRYGFAQVGVTGVSPDIEPSALQLKEVAEVVGDREVTTVYAETLVSPDLVETLGRETGARVAVLDPVEGITDESAGRDYFAVMRSNLETLRAGQGCG